MSVELDQLRIRFPENVNHKSLKIAAAITGEPIRESCKGEPIIQTLSKKKLQHLKGLLGRARG